MKYLVLLVMLTSCASSEPTFPTEPDSCGEPVRKYRNGSQYVPEYDDRNEAAARKGCIQFYGKGACLTVFIKTGPDSYWAMCRRKGI